MLMIFCTIPLLTGQDRSFRIGFQASPVLSGIRSGSNIQVSTGGNFGWKLGIISDIHLKNKMFLTAGVNLAFKEGGEILYEVGGNYLPNSDLSDPLLQSGDKPLPDGVKIRYKNKYLEFPVGLKFRTESKGNISYFLEAPLISFSFVLKGRGDIESEDFLYTQENIYNDLVVPNIFLGLGAGLEYAINRNNSLMGGLYYQHGLFDVTKNKGWMAVQNPNINPTYLRIKDDAQVRIGNFVVFVGLLF
jgi:hypothetical protein